MRLRSLSLFVFVLLSVSSFAQWVLVPSGSTDRLRYIKPVSASLIWGCGNAGKVYKSTDGGLTWTITVTSATAVNYTVEAFDATTAWVTGTEGGSINVSIWKTTDGGATWVSQYNNPNSFGDAVRFFNANDGVYYGDPDPYPSTNWEILTTSNGGTTWTRVPRANFPGADSANGEYGTATSIEVVGNTVWFTGYSGVAGTPFAVYKSTNKGLNWTRTDVPSVNGTSGSSYIAFENEQRGVLVALNGTTARTTDGGATWTTSSVTGAGFRAVVNLRGTNRYVAVGSAGASWITYDGGVTWTPIEGINTTVLYTVGAFNGIPWAAGNGGEIRKWNGPALPVEFTALSANVTMNKVTINWTTATEKNNRGFEVERKAADGEYITLAFVEGAGTTLEARNYSFSDLDVTAGLYNYRIKQVDYDGRYAYSDEIEVNVTTPEKFELSQNYPNPFNPSTTISYAIKFDGNVTLRVYDFTGNQVAELVNGVQQAGSYTVQFDASGLSSGVYFYTLSAPGFNSTKKLTLIK
ncbi:MAG: T9SS type A sorting domain-containing protein [Ignavibacteriales bacterium]|nr:MAG: T9SS type A sorting domain-containing protein [Ignavibacteriales bacterium]